MKKILWALFISSLLILSASSQYKKKYYNGNLDSVRASQFISLTISNNIISDSILVSRGSGRGYSAKDTILYFINTTTQYPPTFTYLNMKLDSLYLYIQARKGSRATIIYK